jgi:hypothetical protein
MANEADNSTRNHIGTYYANVEMPGGFTHNLVNTLKRINHYYHGKFESGEFDEKGQKKLFFNISKPPCDVASKFTDIDTKDALLYSIIPGSEWQVWLMQHDLKQWLKEKNIGKLFNEINQDYPSIGHVFIKKVGDTWKKVNIFNMRFDPSSQSLETDTWIYEALQMTPRQIKEMKWNGDVATLLKEKRDKYLIYECYDYNISGGKKWTRTFKAGVWDFKQGDKLLKGTEALFNSELDWLPSLVLHTDQVDELPYRELKWEDVPGRRPGKGFVEYLFDDQIAENEAENLERKALYFKALQAWYTRDENIGGKNVFDGLTNGDFILTSAEIASLPKDNADLSAYNNTRNRWKENRGAKTFSTDISRGENLPSRTPLGVANIQAQMLISYFDGKKENFGLFLKPLFLEEIIPSFKKDANRRHTLTLLTTTEGIGKYLQMQAKEMIDGIVMAQVAETGKLPSKMQVDMMQTQLVEIMKQSKNISIDIPDAYYDDAKYRFDINFTGEQVDTATASTSMGEATQLMASNPVIIQNKGMRTMLFKRLEYAGVNPIDLNLMEEEIQANPLSPEDMMQGGSIATGKPAPAPSVNTSSKTY